MRTIHTFIDPDSSEDTKIKEIADIIRQGGIVAIPTETVYGLACDANNKNAVDRLYGIKKRDTNKPFAIQIADFLQIKDFSNEVDPGLEKILKAFWPGPLTVIVNGSEGTVGLRMPDNKIALSIIKTTRAPLAVTSANLSGQPAIYSAKETLSIFEGMIDAVVDDGTEPRGIESTVLDCTVSPYSILREGSIADKLRKQIALYG